MNFEFHRIHRTSALIVRPRTFASRRDVPEFRAPDRKRLNHRDRAQRASDHERPYHLSHCSSTPPLTGAPSVNNVTGGTLFWLPAPAGPLLRPRRRPPLVRSARPLPSRPLPLTALIGRSWAAPPSGGAEPEGRRCGLQPKRQHQSERASQAGWKPAPQSGPDTPFVEQASCLLGHGCGCGCGRLWGKTHPNWQA